jgi:hypothetical protein
MPSKEMTPAAAEIWERIKAQTPEDDIIVENPNKTVRPATDKEAEAMQTNIIAGSAKEDED